MADVLFLFFAATFISLLCAVILRRIALKSSIVAVPGGHRRHAESTPLLGGVALFLSMAICAYLFILPGQIRQFGGFISIASIFFLIGLADDLHPLSGLAKLLMQLPIVIFFVWISVIFQSAGGELQYIAKIVAILWILGLANGINFIDGLDGLCTGSVFLMSVSLAIIMFIWGLPAYPTVFIAVVLAGISLGFLKINKFPASVFLGDSGSLFMGCLLAGLSVWVIDFTMPISWIKALGIAFCFALPVADCGLTVLRRIRLHRPLFKSDWGHIHHRLLDIGVAHKSAVHILWLAQIVVCGLAIAINIAPAPYDLTLLLLAAASVAAMYAALLRKEYSYARRN